MSPCPSCRVVSTSEGRRCSVCVEKQAATGHAFVRRDEETAMLPWQRCASCGSRRSLHDGEQREPSPGPLTYDPRDAALAELRGRR